MLQCYSVCKITVQNGRFGPEQSPALCSAPTKMAGCLIMLVARLVACVDTGMSRKRLKFHVSKR
jgi:hypothetical protein